MKYLTIFSVILLTILTIMLVFWTIMIFTKPSGKYTVNVSSETVIKQIHSLNRLETASFTIEKIIDAQTSGNKLQQLLYGDRILLIAHGEAIAGIDLSKVKENDITVSDNTIKMKLPAPEILVARLDNEQTRVYDRQQGFLTKGNNDLESEARKEAEVVVRDAACKGNILDEASKNAKSQLTALFKSLGFVKVEIEIPPGKC